MYTPSTGSVLSLSFFKGIITRLGDKMANTALKRASMIKYVMRLLLGVDIPYPSYHKKE